MGGEHYKYIVIIHLFFFFSWVFEVLLRQCSIPTWWVVPFIFFLLLQVARIWLMCSLGPYWNTRIYVVPRMLPVNRGPYRWVKHPNYWVVIGEMVTLPLIFGAWFTAVVPTLTNFFFLIKVRIPVEERALREAAHSTMPSSTKSAK